MKLATPLKKKKTHFLNHNSICTCESLMAYSVSRHCCLEGGPRIGSPGRKCQISAFLSLLLHTGWQSPFDTVIGRNNVIRLNLNLLNFVLLE